MPGGRPSNYHVEIAEEICRLLTARKIDGSPYALKDVCEAIGIAESTVYYWKSKHPEFLELYERARLDRAEMMAEDVLRVVDTDPDPASARVKMDARKWYAAKLNPKQWGDKVMGDPDNPLVVKDDSEIAELRSRLARLHARGAEGSGSENDQQ